MTGSFGGGKNFGRPKQKKGVAPSYARNGAAAYGNGF